jgi:hypothetical protein
MTSNGLVLYFVLGLVALGVSREGMIPWVPLLLGFALALSNGVASRRILVRAVVVTMPLVGWLAVIWVWAAARTPDLLLIYRPTSGETAWWAVAAVGIRLFALALLTLAAAGIASRLEPSFALRLSAPRSVKTMILAAASFALAMREGLGRAHTALIAANVVSSRRSLLNFRSGWILFRTTWVAALGVAMERLDSKWELEGLPESAPLQEFTHPRLSLADAWWLTASSGLIVARIL